MLGWAGSGLGRVWFGAGRKTTVAGAQVPCHPCPNTTARPWWSQTDPKSDQQAKTAAQAHKLGNTSWGRRRRRRSNRHAPFAAGLLQSAAPIMTGLTGLLPLPRGYQGYQRHSDRKWCHADQLKYLQWHDALLIWFSYQIFFLLLLLGCHVTAPPPSSPRHRHWAEY